MSIILASQSPRRRELLAQMGLADFIIRPTDFDYLNMSPPPVAEFRFLQLPVKNRRYFGEWLNVSWDEAAAVEVDC